jgi:predicted polyphosphate/ATP-dependent NAD kinase
MQAGCVTTGSVEIDTTFVCKSFRPIPWSRRDTRLTAKEIKEHNAVVKQFCGGAK